jgi:hypothetical protein
MASCIEGLDLFAAGLRDRQPGVAEILQHHVASARRALGDDTDA